ncbi:FliI/YscN family ATPase [Acetobacter okinawensis]|uniref:FliI/YscN family ATPase n=1 Tax=Acetobacter okinawensis TaxID=1076594 RepID=UPI0015D88C31|nr:FliI/YscN family ATPase [Acetobacter okinawensis]
MKALANFAQRLTLATPRPVVGQVVRVSGGLAFARVEGAALGEICRIALPDTDLLAEVVGFEGVVVRLAPIGSMQGIAPGSIVYRTGGVLKVPVDSRLLGQVLDGFGRPLDGEHLPEDCAQRPCADVPPSALYRHRVSEPLATGLRVIDGFLTCGKGQRVGIFGEAGCGKSTLLGQLVRGARADVVVVALVGERGREVRDFLEHQLDPPTRARTVLVAATSDRPPLERIRASMTATTIAEWFRDQGKHVLLVVDSMTRHARALREVGLAAGEAPGRGGFPSSVMAELPRLLERAGPGDERKGAGMISAFYTVLVEGEGDPVAEEMRSILDGHILLSPTLAMSGHYPAIDVMTSRSRLMSIVATPEHCAHAARIRALLHRYEEVRFLVEVGEYQPGGDALADEALAKIDEIRAFLKQGEREVTPFSEVTTCLQQIA